MLTVVETTNICPVFKSLSSVIAYSYRNENPTSIKQLNFYQDQNHDIMALQETNSKESSLSLKNRKTKSYTAILDKKLGYGVVTMIKSDIKNVFRDDLLNNKLEPIWNLITNNRQTLMGNIHIHANNNKMLQKLDSELEHHTETPLIILGDFNAKHPAWDHSIKKPNRNGEILADLIRHNLEIYSDVINTFIHLYGSSIIDLVLTRYICNIKCQTKKS